jgi:ADP-ribose pyrophosphatase
MSLTAPRGRLEDVVEDWVSAPVVESSVPFSGLIFDVRRDRVDLGDGGVVVRDFIEHPGAVAVVALQPFDGVDHILMIRQYRHAARGHVWELPAGLLDVDGEPHWQAAARELAEEVDLEAGQWDLLVDELVSAGAFPEPVRIFLARDLTDVAGPHLHERRAEELTIRPLWVSLDDALEAALAGRISNSAALIGVFAAHACRAKGWAALRPKDAPWPAWEAQRAPRSGASGS